MSDDYLVPISIIQAIETYAADYCRAETQTARQDALKLCVLEIDKEIISAVNAFKSDDASAQTVSALRSELQACRDKIHSMMLEMNELRNAETVRFLNRLAMF